MWRENLPDQCPPLNACNIEETVYRITADRTLAEEDFIPIARLKPENKRYKDLCIAHAVSFFDSYDNARAAFARARERNKILGNYIVQLSVNHAHGVSEYEDESGHHSFWFYRDFTIDQLEVLDLQEC
ncbi:hypothetical protein [Dyadobacter jiangsuensis]|uniref:hypothetical protein n=1 Tax=Dyadobacter jiangsuensis TaxID=1591085 RepID=UPI000D0DF47E|nr:hypothetical protein [Dyadobacter jiangsuensis]